MDGTGQQRTRQDGGRTGDRSPLTIRQKKELHERIGYVAEKMPHVPSGAPGSLTRKIYFLWKRIGWDAPSFVYFIRCGEYVKIGTGSDPSRRMQDLACGNPYDLMLLGVLPGDGAFERRLHELCWAWRHRGEWYHHEGALAVAIATLALPPSEWPLHQPRARRAKDEKINRAVLRAVRST